MNTITIPEPLVNLNTTKTKSFSLKEAYSAIIEKADHEPIVWYIKAVIIIPCVFMVLSILAMYMATENYVWFVTLSMVLFFANIMVHIAGAKANTFVPLYHITALVLFLIPCIVHLIY